LRTWASPYAKNGVARKGAWGSVVAGRTVNL
jgi:hypothetical protein